MAVGFGHPSKTGNNTRGTNETTAWDLLFSPQTHLKLSEGWEKSGSSSTEDEFISHNVTVSC